ncbi:hypothetical protein ACFWEH_12790 [Streptomyces anulatus]|uniref:hypothetical protein n=1 Tax=Streptomyces TaxID=1883 RepID=UPI00095E7763|nr:hypothetical protein [Streptomyces sp. TSRI0395]OKI83751.1 hypothetical protein AMK12_11520 [Streptomyces sp. TSRI0395]
MDPTERALRARLGAHQSWANTTDRTARTAGARRAAESKFEEEARQKHPGATEAQVAAAAESLRKAHFTRMGFLSAQARRKKRASP